MSVLREFLRRSHTDLWARQRELRTIFDAMDRYHEILRDAVASELRISPSEADDWIIAQVWGPRHGDD